MRPLILLISSEKSDHNTFCASLDEKQFRLMTVPSYLGAMFALSREPVTVVFCRDTLPDGSWKDVFGQACEMVESPPVVVLLSEESGAGEAIRLGAFDVLPPSFDRYDILRVLAGICGRSAGGAYAGAFA